MRRNIIRAMRVFLASDHAAFDGRVALRDGLQKVGATLEVVDLGCATPERCNYPDYASKVCKELQTDPEALGILVCGSGIGMSMAANKFKGIRAALCHNAYTARLARSQFGANILCMGARTTGGDIILESAKQFLTAAPLQGAQDFVPTPAQQLSLPAEGLGIVIGVSSTAPGVEALVAEEAGKLGKVAIASGDSKVSDVCGAVTARGGATVGILISDAAVDVAMAANKHRGIRAAVCFEEYTSAVTRQHNDANVICFGSDSVGSGLLRACVSAYLSAKFEGGRHADRVALISAIEAGSA